MFRCQNKSCGKQVPPRQPMNRIVTERRDTTYQKKIIKRRKIVDIVDIHGWEIVREICVCPQCFIDLTGKQPKLIAPQQKPQVRRYRKFGEQPSTKRKWQNPKAKKRGIHTKGAPSPIPTRKKLIVEKINPIQPTKR